MTELAEKMDEQPKPFRLSRVDYYRMAEQGFFFGRRVELIAGKVYTMPPHGDRHEASVGMVVRRLMKAFGDDYWVRPQMSLALKPKSALEPDVAVVRGVPEQMMGEQTSALLVVEVSESSLGYDQRRKSRLYARNGIEDFWIINLIENVIEVYRSPMKDGARPYGFRYASVTKVHLAENVSPLALPSVEIAVFDLLPLKR